MTQGVERPLFKPHGLAPIALRERDRDEGDRLLVRDALTESRLLNPLHTVEDGEELMDYLRRRGRFATYGVSSFVVKPVTFALVSLVKELGHYWFELTELPQEAPARAR